MADFYTILTNIGKARFANAYTLGTQIDITKFAVGDGNGSYYNPTEEQVALKNELWRGNINSIKIDEERKNWIVIEVVMPAEVGGITIREAAIFDAEGNMLAIGKYPETYKPALAEGSAKDLYIRMIIEVSNTSSVSLKIDPSIVLASKKDLESLPQKNGTLQIGLNAEMVGGKKISEIEDAISSFSSDLSNQFTNFQNGVDAQLAEKANKAALNKAQLEIQDLKMQLEENALIDFVNKTGVGYYDMFTDTDGVDAANTTATYSADNDNYEFDSSGTQKVAMREQEFDTFNSIEMSLYPTLISKAAIKGAVDNAVNVITGATDRELAAGDKLFVDGAENDIVACTVNFTENVVEDATVVASSYDTSGNGGKKLVKLSNGTFVSIMKSASSFYVFYSFDNGSTWILKKTLNFVVQDISIETNGDIVYILMTNQANQLVRLHYFNNTGDSILTGSVNVDTAQTSLGGCSLTINEQKTELHACWSSKNATYAGSYNLRYAKGTINEDGSITWGAVKQLTTTTGSYAGLQNPSIVALSNNKLCITYQMVWTYYAIGMLSYDGISWQQNNSGVYNGDGYPQFNPCARFVPKEINGLPQGRIWVAWCGRKTGTNDSCLVSYSDDAGISWSDVYEFIPVDNPDYQIYYAPTLTCNKNNEIFILASRRKSSATGILDLVIIKNSNDLWSEPSIFYEGTSGEDKCPATIFDYTLDFEIPLFIYEKDSTKIGFYGTWTVGEGYTLEMTNPVTLADGEQVPVVDFQAKQNIENFTLKSIDSEKYNFEKTGLSTTVADIEIIGKSNKLDKMVYTVG